MPLTADGEQLARMTECFTGNLRVQLLRGEEILIDSAIPVTILAYDEWQGSEVHPELLSAFVMPNNPEIVPVIFRASEGEFCLELHSNKSIKRKVLDRLRIASEVTKTVSA